MPTSFSTLPGRSAMNGSGASSAASGIQLWKGMAPALPMAPTMRRMKAAPPRPSTGSLIIDIVRVPASLPVSMIPSIMQTSVIPTMMKALMAVPYGRLAPAEIIPNWVSRRPSLNTISSTRLSDRTTPLAMATVRSTHAKNGRTDGAPDMDAVPYRDTRKLNPATPRRMNALNRVSFRLISIPAPSHAMVRLRSARNSQIATPSSAAVATTAITEGSQPADGEPAGKGENSEHYHACHHERGLFGRRSPCVGLSEESHREEAEKVHNRENCPEEEHRGQGDLPCVEGRGHHHVLGEESAKRRDAHHGEGAEEEGNRRHG